MMPTIESEVRRVGRSRTVLPWILLAAAVLVLSVQVVDLMNFMVDDAFIVLRVVNNVLHGSGFVYNHGQYIEGYSDWLWVVMLLGPIALVNGATPDLWSAMWVEKGLSLLFGIGTLVALYFLAKAVFSKSEARDTLAAGSVLALAACAPFVAWSLGGLETTLFAFLFTTTLLVIQHLDRRHEAQLAIDPPRSILLGSLFGMIALTRPEGILHAGVLLLVVIGLLRWRFRSIVVVSVTFGLLVGGFLGWRWLTYGTLLPNTYYAKIGMGSGGLVIGVKYYLAGLYALLGPLILFFPLGWLASSGTKRFLAVAGSLIVTTSAFSLYAGGDWMPGARFLVPIAPILILVAVRGVGTVFVGIRPLIASGAFRRWVLSCALLVIPFTTVFNQRSALRGELPALASGFVVRIGHSLPDHVKLGAWLETNEPRSFTLATGEAGLIGYMNPKMTLIDCLGLMDTTISHRMHRGLALDPEYILQQHPDVIVLYGKAGATGHEVHATPYSELLRRDPNLDRDYSLATEIGEFQVYTKRDSGSGFLR